MRGERLVTKLTPELSCTDITKSLSFYTDVLGFSVQYTRPEDGFAMLERQGSRLMLDQLHAIAPTSTGRSWVTAPMEYPFGRGINFQIEATDVDELHAHAQKCGANIYLPIEEKWYRADDTELGNRQFIVLDPDGYMLRFFQDLGTRPVK